MKTEKLVWFIWDKNNPTTAFTYCDSVNDCPAAIERAKAYRSKDIATYKSHLKNYPDRSDYWNKMLEKSIDSNYVCGEWEVFEQAQKGFLIGEIHEITAEEWDDALNVLPPLGWNNYPHGFNMFFCSEAYTGTYASQYARKGGKYYSAMVDKADRSTWINVRLAHA